MIKCNIYLKLKMIIYPRKTRVFTKSSSKNGHSGIQLRYDFIIAPFYYYTKHGGRIGHIIMNR